MALSVHNALSDLSKLEPLDGTNYKRSPQKLLIFFEQVEVDYVLFSYLPQENNTFETTIASTNRVIKDKPRTVDEETKIIRERQQNG